MRTYTWEQQRIDIQAVVDDFFDTHISIGPRAMAALQAGEEGDSDELEQVLGEGAHVVFEEQIAESLLQSCPAVAMTLFNLGVDLTKLSFSPSKPAPAPLYSLDWVFEGVEAESLVPQARKVLRRRQLDEIDLLVSLLEASVEGTEPNAFGGRLLEAAGIEQPPKRRGHADWKACDSYLRNLRRQAKKIVQADPSHGLVQFALYLDDRGRVHIRPFGVTGLARLSLKKDPLSEEERYIYRGGILQPIAAIGRGLTEDVLNQLEEMIENDYASEHNFQAFFERHPLLLTGVDFTKAHPQPILYQDEGGPLIPDFFLEKLSAGWDAILDLKKPYDGMVTRRKNRIYFKQHVQEAIAQLRFYREWFESPTNRRLFQERYGVSTFRPRMIIVIGRSIHFRDDVERVRLLDSLSQGVEIWTYDDLLARARRYLELAGTV